ncbi:MAG: hypothetical protein NT036_02855 [Candidatus Omnitrophica bacterium]|nr:hypothetical protein [Candidatus Omnitrophota bacterium]
MKKLFLMVPLAVACIIVPASLHAQDDPLTYDTILDDSKPNVVAVDTDSPRTYATRQGASKPESSNPESSRSMVNMRGKYGASFGFTTEDGFEWKDANGDYQEKNWRYINPQFGVNTYDERVFDRYELEIETATRTPWNAYMDIVIDPWTFVMKQKQTVVNTNLGLGDVPDSVDVEYKLWENTGRTIGERYRTEQRSPIYFGELKVVGNQVAEQLANGNTETGTGLMGDFYFSRGRSVDMGDYFYRPVRKLWVDYDKEPLYIKIFPISDQEEALSSDDPLGISNHHIYWAPSPWLYNFDFGRVYAANATDGNFNQFQNPVIQESRWDNTLPFFTRDTNRTFLTFLRGGTLKYQSGDLASFQITAASPMGLWDYYKHVDSIPIASRLKVFPTDNIDLGVTQASKMGLHDQGVRASNNSLGVDIKYRLNDDTSVIGELVGSYSQYDYATHFQQGYYGFGYKTGIHSQGNAEPADRFSWDLTFTTMTKRFQPGLADYRDTRVDQPWGQHIWFDQIASEDAVDRIGDSVDVNRYVIGAKADIVLIDKLLEVNADVRNAHRYDNSKFIENISRVEATYKPAKNIELKGLVLNRIYPKTAGGLDPFLKDRYTDEPWINPFIGDGFDANLMTYSGGAKVDLMDNKVSVYGIFETTNDPQEFPRRELSDLYFANVTQTTPDDTDGWMSDGTVLFDRLPTQLYLQNLFQTPPYTYYNIIKAKISYFPCDGLSISYTHVTNTNKNYAPLLDDNHTHDGVDIVYKATKKLTLRGGYSLSKIIDLRKAIDTNAADQDYEYHNNLYLQADYIINKDQRVIFQFGEYGLLQKTLGMFGAPLSQRYLSSPASVLDTRSIFRIFYEGKF